MKRRRRKHSPEFKARVALEAIREQSTAAEIAGKYKIHATVVHKWKKELLEKLPQLFEGNGSGLQDATEREAELLKKIGELTMERDFLSDGLGRMR